MIVVDHDINGITHLVCFRERQRATRGPEPESASRAEPEVQALEAWVDETRRELAFARVRARQADGQAGMNVVAIYQRVSRHVARVIAVAASRHRLHRRLGA
jgi:hypothetical protein